MEGVTIVDAASAVRRGQEAEPFRALVVCADSLDRSPFLARATRTLHEAGWHISVAAPVNPAIDQATWHRIPGMTRDTVRRVRQLARLADLVLLEPGSLAIVRRAHLAPPVVLLVQDELLGARTRRLPTDHVDLAIAASHAAAAPLRWRGIETTVASPPLIPAVECPRHDPGDVIGCAASFDAGAGLDILLDAFAQLARPELRLEVVNVDGSSDERLLDGLRARAAHPDLDGRVTFIEHVDDHRVLMQRWRVAVMANVAADSATLQLRDAVALGVSVVATDRGANTEVVGEHGLVVRPGRTADLADALARALDDDVAPRANGRGRADVIERTDGEPSPGAGTTDDLLAVLTDLTRRGVRRRSGTIVFVVPDYEPTLGGTTRQTHNQARELQARGYDVLVLTQRLQAHWPRTEVRDGIRLRRIGPSGRTLLRMKLLVLSVAWWLRQHRDEIAVVNAIMYPDFVVSASLAGLGERTVMCWAGLGDATDTVGTLGPLRAPLRTARRHALSRGAQVALTPALHDELERLGLGRDVSVIPTPVDVEAFRPPTPDERADARRALRVEDDELVVAYTGHLRALKRVERLVEAFGLLVASGRPARLLLVGSPRDDLGDQPVALQRELDRLTERDRVIITGAVADVRLYLWAADAFVLPSDREGLSNSVLEALAVGLPVVAPASAAGDQVLDDTCGIVPRSNDAVDLYDALTQLGDRPDYRARLATGARQAAERFALARVVNEYEGLYSRLQRRDTVR